MFSLQMRIGILPALVDLLFLIIHEIFYLSTYGTQLNNNMRYHVGIGCSFGASDHNVHKRVAEKLDAHFINLSEAGRGNFRIYTELLYWSAVNKEKLNDTTFSIGWSGIYRNDMIETHGGKDNAFCWTRWRADRDDPMNKHLPEKVDVQTDHTIRFLCNVLATQNLLKILKCNYIMYNGTDTYGDRNLFDPQTAVRIRMLEKQIDMASFYEFQKSHQQFVVDNKYFLDPRPASVLRKITNWPTDDAQYPVVDAHPSAIGNSEWADILWKYCKENQIL